MTLYRAIIETDGPREVRIYAENSGIVAVAISGQAKVRLERSQAAQLIDALRDAIGAIEDAADEPIGREVVE